MIIRTSAYVCGSVVFSSSRGEGQVSNRSNCCGGRSEVLRWTRTASSSLSYDPTRMFTKQLYFTPTSATKGPFFSRNPQFTKRSETISPMAFPRQQSDWVTGGSDIPVMLCFSHSAFDLLSFTSQMPSGLSASLSLSHQV